MYNKHFLKFSHFSHKFFWNQFGRDHSVSSGVLKSTINSCKTSNSTIKIFLYNLSFIRIYHRALRRGSCSKPKVGEIKLNVTTNN